MLTAGAASVDITPPPGLHLAGFAARTEPATGAHDPITARALVVGDTAVVTVDLLGVPGASARRIRARCALPDEHVVIAATHTHGAPIPASGRYAGDADPAFVAALENGCVAAIDGAVASARPATLEAGMGRETTVGKNRRHPGGPVDFAVPVLRVTGRDGGAIAVLTSYACHPVVLGADNRLMTGDYPHFVRARIEDVVPGAVAMFMTGCCGDVNTGHSAHASWTRSANADRTFERAEDLGGRIAEAALGARLTPLCGEARAAGATVTLEIERQESEPLQELAERWRAEAGGADPVRRLVLETWIDWAERFRDTPTGSWTGRVAALDWGGLPIVSMPGEIFTETGLSVRAACGTRPAFVTAYGEGIPGYIPPEGEYPFGGYEVAESHRFAGRPGAFRPGMAERVGQAARTLLAEVTKAATAE
ncbi:alkaline ceramidase [Rhodobacterales bacterium HKCCE2091]|nr:alkaline ceramidase [Rhodobacterales bacterium HKCCE2091]